MTDAAAATLSFANLLCLQSPTIIRETRGSL